ncbi:ParB/RepB/Spo0J family partition protein [Thiomicrorhabdus xiamenensis]|uniref:Probable chromosome-partitioning protein ParB n=2 Tax=Thiomicrorhabdus xiamenensis TaxID=2739063 RepID=A0A7D4NMT3_9GAMM|nr:ParB/RepB/Spo0J family partition protein [Thiomicrorhabdus xiamenensis]
MGKRGLSAMLGAKQKSEKNVSDLRVEKLPVDQLKAGQYQPRQQFNDDSLAELAASIKVQGVVQPIVVRSLNDDSYEIIAGERRWRAAKLAGLEHVPVVIRQADGQTTLAMALIENIQRENLNPIETAIGLKRLLQEFELTQQEVADAVGYSRSAVSNLLRLLKLPEAIQQALHDGKITMGHARAVISMPEPIQNDLVKKAVQNGWSVRQMEQAAQEVLVPSAVKKAAKDAAKPKFEFVDLHQESLAKRLDAKVQIKHKENGRGKIEISYKDEKELQRLSELLTQK